MPRQTLVERHSSAGRYVGRGGIPAWDSMLVNGPAGSGKSALATQFIAAGLTAGEPAVIAVFEEHPNEFVAHARGMAPDLQAMSDKGLLKVIYLRPLDLSVDEALLRCAAATIARTCACTMSPPTGVEIGGTLLDYRGVITGVARRHLVDESVDATEPAEKTRQVEQLIEAYEQERAQPNDPEAAPA